MLEKTEPKSIWRAYQRMNQLLDHLPSHTAAVVSQVLEHGVTEEVIRLAQNAPDEERQRYQILRIIGNGNPDRLASLTEVALDEIRLGLQEGDLP